MRFLVAISALFVFLAANGLAISTLVSSSWRTTLALVKRRHQLCRIALFSVPGAAACRYLLLGALVKIPTSTLSEAILSVLLFGFLPLFARGKTAQLLEGFEVRDLIAGRD
jgi:hypothetical protein